MTHYYYIVEIFLKRKLSQIGEKWDFADKTLLDCLLISLQTITETNFADRHKTAKFAKAFSLKSFLLYSMHCHCNIGLQLTYIVYNSILPLLTMTFRCIHVQVLTT